MIRVLQSVNVMDRAGLETMLMAYYRNIDRNKVQFDFLTHRPTEGAYDKEIETMGGQVYHAPRLYPKNYLSYFKFMKQFFADHPEYKIIHSHIDAMSAFPLFAAKKSNIPNRIAHSHSSKLDKDFKLPIKFVALKFLPYVSNLYCACGNVAGKFMFDKQPFKVINNAIDLEAFSFNQETREKKRKELGISDEFVVGHVGRYCYIKNQLFLIDIFSEILRENPNSILLLVGKGEDEQKIRNKISKLKLQDKVKLLIDRSDVAELYQVMDVFVMPSLFEGLPVVGVEAQASGLPCFISDKISKELCMTSNIQVLKLNDDAERWATAILLTGAKRNENATEQLRAKGYDIKIEAKKLMDWYLEL